MAVMSHMWRTYTKETSMIVEADYRVLFNALNRIANGTYDGLEVSYYNARKCRDIAKAALKIVEHPK